ncbi:MAG: ribosome biogenesis GTPase Der [Deltaproteobacteria bacterium]|nr:ribosome biogenesis GTPase Der [Deltaproteobacteria bacterium]
MIKPIVAIVGRPNVGKSTLFNRLIGHSRSIVADEPGVTRDRIYADAALRGVDADFAVVLVDTGGLDPDTVDPIAQRVLDQTQLAIDEADVIVFLADGRAGLLPEDVRIADVLRRSTKPVILAVNKIDGTEHEGMTGEFHRLGMAETLPISAAHGKHIHDLEEVIASLLPEGTARIEPPPEEERRERGSRRKARAVEGTAGEPEVAEPAGPIRVAVIGRPNVGKSSLINRLLGEDRHLVSEVAGTTRDAIDSLIERAGRQYLFIDTAGIRRKRSIALRLEQFSVVAALKGLDRSDVALLLLDPLQGVAEQDAKISAFAFEKGKALVLVVSKWDQKQGETKQNAYAETVRQALPHLAYAPILFTSAHTGQGLDRVFPTIERVYQEHGHRVSTGELNRFLEEMLHTHPPPTKKGKRAKIYYVRQIGVRPPRFLASVNDPELLHFSYRRYLVNELRKRYGFSGVPLLVGYRSRSRKER